MRIIFLIISLLFFGVSQAQDLVFKASFDDGTVNDDLGSNDGISVGSIADCGLGGDLGRVFRGSDFINYPSDVNRLLENAFTLSFYVQIENDKDESTAVNLISIRNECGDKDSSFVMNYFPKVNKLIADYWDDGDLIRVEAVLNPEDCWHHIVLVNNIAELSLYINGVRKDVNADIARSFVLDSTAMFRISPPICLGAAMGAEVGFEGTMDELCIFNEAMDERQVQALYVQPDKILTRDVSIIKGGSVAIQTLESCASELTWFPTTGVSPPSDIDPIITPEETTTYALELDYGFCQSTDSITITVIPEIDCETVSLPTAFTPNNDMLNDELGISNPIFIEELKSFQIFDKWGAKMFETADKNGTWDGYFNGVIPNTNTFLYRINYNCKGQEYFKSGSFTILR